MQGLRAPVKSHRELKTYDYIVVNDTVEHGVEVIHQLINDERNGQPEQNASYRVSANIDFINKNQEKSLQAFRKENNTMIHPSYVELMKVVNDGVEFGEEPVVNSRYSIVLATAKRARQIIAGAEPMIENPKCNKPLSIAVEELYRGDVKIVSDEEDNN